MPTKGQLEVRTEDLAECIADLDTGLRYLLEGAEDVHDRTHLEPWSICSNPMCRLIVTEIEDVRAAIVDVDLGA